MSPGCARAHGQWLRSSLRHQRIWSPAPGAAPGAAPITNFAWGGAPPLTNTAQSRLRHQRTWSSAPGAAPVINAVSVDCPLTRLDAGVAPSINLAQSRLCYQLTPGVALLLIDIAWSRLRHQRLCQLHRGSTVGVE
jgi:hypothetical protein